MQKSWRNITIALAGVIQAANLVEQVAKTGYLNTEEFETAVQSLLTQTSDDTESVFGGVHQVRHGLEILGDLLQDHRNPKYSDVLRYVLGVMHLQKRLARRSDVLYVIGNRLDKANDQVQHFSPTHDNVISNIADIYSDTISKFQYRIQVMGEYSYLQQPRVANQVRVLLLAAIRAATLWRQVGGSRWQLIFYRNRLKASAEELIKASRVH